MALRRHNIGVSAPAPDIAALHARLSAAIAGAIAIVAVIINIFCGVGYENFTIFVS